MWNHLLSNAPCWSLLSGPGTLTACPSPINLTARIKNPPTCVEADNEPFTQRRVVIYRGLTQQGAVTADDVRAETRPRLFLYQCYKSRRDLPRVCAVAPADTHAFSRGRCSHAHVVLITRRWSQSRRLEPNNGRRPPRGTFIKWRRIYPKHKWILAVQRPSGTRRCT